MLEQLTQAGEVADIMHAKKQLLVPQAIIAPKHCAHSEFKVGYSLVSLEIVPADCPRDDTANLLSLLENSCWPRQSSMSPEVHGSATTAALTKDTAILARMDMCNTKWWGSLTTRPNGHGG